MFVKAVFTIVVAAAIALTLLGQRQQRFEVMHEMTRLHGGMNRSRQSMWDLQVRIASRVEPARLAEALARAKLRLEPALVKGDAQAAPALSRFAAAGEAAARE